MDKKEIFDALDDFSQNLLTTLAEVDAIKKHLQGVIDENTTLRLENSKLRERLEKKIRQAINLPTLVRRIWRIFTKMVSIFVPSLMVNVGIMMNLVCSV